VLGVLAFILESAKATKILIMHELCFICISNIQKFFASAIQSLPFSRNAEKRTFGRDTVKRLKLLES